MTKTAEKRKAQPPIPPGIETMLTDGQRLTLRRMEQFGWRIAFVRRPLFQEILVVLTSSDGGSLGILESDGELNMEMNIQVRG